MIAEISRDGMLTIYGQTETERYAMKQWYASYARGDESPSPWGIRMDFGDRVATAYRQTPEVE